MKLRVHGIHCGDCLRTITRALLRLDLGARINFSPAADQVRIEGRLSVDAARHAIEDGGFEASVIDGTMADAAFRARGDVLVL